MTHAAQKRAIAAAVYNLIEDEDTLFLDGGTTLMEVARCIAAGNKRVTVITNAVQLSCEVCAVRHLYRSSPYRTRSPTA